MVTREFLGLAATSKDLSKDYTLYFHKPREIVLVGEYKQPMLRAF